MNQIKKFVFAGISILLFFMFLTAAEFLLEKIYPDLTIPLVTEVRYDQIQWFQINRRYLEQYFGGDDYLIPEFKPSLFRKEKTDSTFRIICLGESSMFGVPYQMTANIPGILRRQLRHLYPHKEIEVINFGASAINTNVIRDFSERLLDYTPDLILIYTGHNEFYGPDGVGASWLEKKIPSLIQLKYRMNRLAIVKLFSLIGNGKAQNKKPIEESLMKQVSRNAHVELNSDDARRVMANFKENLTVIIENFKRHNIPVIVSDVTSNMTFPPFEYDRSNDPEFQQVSSLIDQKKYADAGIKLQSLRSGNGENAYYWFLQGKLFQSLQHFDSASQYFSKARDYDLLKFRAPSPINPLIKDACIETHTPFFSTDSIFTYQSGNGISDTSLFWEHLHPNAKGYFLIADGFLRKISDLHLLPEPPAAVRPLGYADDSLYICWLDRAYGDRSITNLVSKWPFHNYAVPSRYYSNASLELQSIVDKVFTFQMVWDQGCYETAQIFWKNKNFSAAITTFRAVVEEYPYNFYAHYLLGSILNQTGKTEEAIEHYKRAIASNPAYPFPFADLALIKINQSEFDEAIALLNQALLLAVGDDLRTLRSTIFYGLSAAYANKGDFSTATAMIRSSLEANPLNNDAMALQQKLASAH